VTEWCHIHLHDASNKKSKNRPSTKNAKSARASHLAPRFPRSPCPIANLLDLVGDKWSLLVVRDLLRGNTTYGELAASPERIPTNILADRLKRLEKAGVISRRPYQKRPVRYAYRLTRKGRALGGILAEAMRWARHHVPGTLAF
jgi:DNA-binding HxlR family transcriptional regulator